MASGTPISPLLLDEYFAVGDERFLPAVREFSEPKKLASIADRWKQDHRPWARKQIFEYLKQPFDAAGHEPVVKHLFKHAETRQDDELMAAFAVAFDRLVRREIQTKHRYDWQTRQSWTEEYLWSPRNRLVAPGSREMKMQFGPKAGQTIHIPIRGRGEILFSYHTRNYLRRRAWRYFRRAGFRRPDEYCAAVARMLQQYTDEDVAAGENLLDNWSLMHACFGDSEILEFTSAYARLKPNRGLSELSAAPAFGEVWQKPGAAQVLVPLVVGARSRAVRVWAIQLLRRHHVEHFAHVPPQELLPLLDHEDAEVQQFAAEMLEKSPGLGRLEVAAWLRLLQTKNVTALETIAQLMLKHVAAERFTLAQLVELASAEPVPVARLGFRLLQTRPITSAEQRQAIARLAAAKCEGVAGELTGWALAILGSDEHYDVENVSPFFDSLLAGARAAAAAWLTPERSRGYNDPALWSRLIETPYDDVRFRVVRALEHRTALPGAADDKVQSIWTTVLLGIHRGGRFKLAALKQISDAIRREPTRAEALLPVLAVALRSVRLPETRAGLSAVVAAVEAHPPLAAAVAKHVPELSLA